MFPGAAIEDPVFGKLKWEHGVWLGKVRVESLGGWVDLLVEGNDPCDEQRRAFEEFLKDQTNIHEELEWALFEYYNGMWFFRFRGFPEIEKVGGDLGTGG